MGYDVVIGYTGNSQGSEIKMHDRRYDHTKQTKAHVVFKFDRRRSCTKEDVFKNIDLRS